MRNPFLHVLLMFNDLLDFVFKQRSRLNLTKHRSEACEENGEGWRHCGPAFYDFESMQFLFGHVSII